MRAASVVIALVAVPVEAAEPSLVHGEDATPHSAHDQVLSSAGMTMTGFAIGTIAAGGITFAIAEHGNEHCGVTGCFRYRDPEGEVAAAGMLAAGVAMATVALPVWLRAGTPWSRRSDRRMVWGIVLTTVGTGALSASVPLVGALVYSEGSRASGPDQLSYEDMWLPAMVQPILGAIFLGVGIPLWATGARSTPDVKLCWSGTNANLQARF